MLGILISSVILAQHWQWVGRVLPLSIITFIHLWSCIECIRRLYTLYQGQRVRNDVESADVNSAVVQQRRRLLKWFSGGLIISFLSMGCLAALPVVDYETFLAVSHRQYGCRMMLITQILYFTCGPGELVWSINMAWGCCSRFLNKRRASRGSSSQPGGEDSHPSRAETRNGTHLESYPNSRDNLDFNGSISSVAVLVPEGSSVKNVWDGRLLKKHRSLGLVAEGSWPAKVISFVL